jgi:hypothetical protein
MAVLEVEDLVSGYVNRAAAYTHERLEAHAYPGCVLEIA